MAEKLTRPSVLVLNKNWQALNTRTPEEAFSQMAADAATALDIDGDSMRPVKWEEWLALPVRPQDEFCRSSRGLVRIPTVIVLCNYAKMNFHRPKLTARTIWQRDGGVCQYSGRKLTHGEGNIDHVQPVSRGGKTSWENCVLADRKINSQKGNKTLNEAGLQLIKRPAVPKEVPACAIIKNGFEIKDWNHFLMN